MSALTKKDFASDQETRWCPGCSDYAILSTVQGLFPELGVRRENVVFISGIGCSSRFPYYMNTYGMHSIHGRAPAIATGLAVSRPKRMGLPCSRRIWLCSFSPLARTASKAPSLKTLQFW